MVLTIEVLAQSSQPAGVVGVRSYMNVSAYKDALLKKRAELEETAGLKPLTDSMEHNNGRQGDMADQARATTKFTSSCG